jgi:hypothetical protein
MRKKAALLLAGLLTGATMSVIGAGPAQAQDTTCTATDPVLAYVCRIVNTAPDPQDLVNHYYYVVFGLTDKVYCTLSPSC